MNGLDLFSGIGGMSLALQPWVNPVAYCEIDRYCQAVLLSRMAHGDLQPAPIWDDVQTLGKESGTFPKSFVDIIYGGFPCQDISIAGHGKGLEGERSGLIYEIFRLARELNPSFIFLENVPAITTRGGLALVKEITSMGYDCRWCIISAASIGASHKRERWFLLAHTPSERCKKTRQPLRSKAKQSELINKIEYSKWDQEPENKFELARVVNGLQDRTHRIKALGNAVVPAQAKEAFKILMGLDDEGMG
jgi:DNA (cytosine-5)-methyltransferase 1